MVGFPGERIVQDISNELTNAHQRAKKDVFILSLKIHDVSKKGRKAYKNEKSHIYIDCIKCENILPINDFYKAKTGFLETKPYCKFCWHKRNVIKENKDWLELVSKNKTGSRKLYSDSFGNSYITCTSCSKVKMTGDFTRNPCSFFQCHSSCKDCLNAKRRANPNHTKSTKLCLLRRRATEKMLPDKLTKKDMLILGEKCVLTKSTNIHMDHVIPLATGHGGTIYKNMIPLSAELNFSKNAKNVFEWGEKEYERLGFTLEVFYEVMSEVAERNNMSLQEYRNYVYWCFENPIVYQEA